MDFGKGKWLKRSLYGFLVAFILLCQTAFAADFSKLVILHTNDSHGYDQSDAEHIGMPVIAQIKKDFQSKGYNVLMLDAGDIIQGNEIAQFDQGQSAIKFMNAVGYDVATLGNHEFDYGLDVLQQRMKEAKFPFVSCNIVEKDTGKNFIKPYVIIEKPYGRIGILGITTPSTSSLTKHESVSNLHFLDRELLYASTQMCVNKLIAENCDLIIALGHLGSLPDCEGSRSEDILKNVNGIDILIDGHDHLVKNDVIEYTLRAETGSYTQNVGCILYEDGRWQEKMIPYGQYTKQDKGLENMVNKAVQEIEKKFGTVIGKADITLDGTEMPGVRNQEMPLGDFCADGILWQANMKLNDENRAQASIFNGGAIRTGIKAGPITQKNMQDVSPFANELSVITIKGSKLLEILEANTQETPEKMGGFPQVAGIEYSINVTVPYKKGPQYPESIFYAPAEPGSRVTVKKVDGQPFNPEAEYRIVVCSFIAGGGDSYGGLLADGAIIAAEPLGITDTAALQNYLKDKLNGEITSEYAAAKGRITIVQ